MITIIKQVFLQYSENLFITGCRNGRDCMIVVNSDNLFITGCHNIRDCMIVVNSDNLFITGCHNIRNCMIVVFTSPYIVYNRCPSVLKLYIRFLQFLVFFGYSGFLTNINDRHDITETVALKTITITITVDSSTWRFNIMW